MRVPIVETKYCSIYYNESLLLFEQFWYVASESMTEEDFKQLHLTWVQKLIKNKYNMYRFLLDNRDNLYQMSTQLQKWHDQNIHQVVLQNVPDASQMKVALVASDDFLTQLGIERTFLENQQLNSHVYYFTDIREARDWLMHQEFSL